MYKYMYKYMYTSSMLNRQKFRALTPYILSLACSDSSKDLWNRDL